MIELFAGFNLLKLEVKRKVYYTLNFGYVKKVTGGSIPQVEEYPTKGGKLFDSWPLKIYLDQRMTRRVLGI